MKEQTLIDMEKKSRNAMSRLDELEQGLTTLTGILDKQINNLIESQGQLVDTINAMLEVVGPDSVQKVLTDKALARLAEQEKQVQEAVASGKLLAVPVVGDGSIVVYEERNSDGTVRVPGKFYRNMFSLNPDARNLIKGKAVDFETPIGQGSLKILAIYEVAPATVLPTVPAAPDTVKQESVSSVTEVL